jgi:uncharacterized membrane protein YqgA involved in biofilm formation
MLEQSKHFLMTVLAVPVAAIGLDAWLKTVTSLVGLYTALTGAVIGTCGMIWWIRRLINKKPKQEKDNQT